MSEHNIKSLRARTGMTQAKFAEHLGIPRRTVEDWERELRCPPEYVVNLIAFRLRAEGLIPEKTE